MSPRRLLLVEDNPQDELLILRALRKSAPALLVDVVRDGQQALDYFFRAVGARQHTGRPPDLILLDIGLPRLSGLQVLEQLRAHPLTHDLPIVVFTSSDDERDRHASAALGANAFERKPVGCSELTETLARLADVWRLLDETPSH